MIRHFAGSDSREYSSSRGIRSGWGSGHGASPRPVAANALSTAASRSDSTITSSSCTSAPLRQVRVVTGVRQTGPMSTFPDRANTALLIIDVQRDVVANAHDRDGVIANINQLLQEARRARRAEAARRREVMSHAKPA